MTHTGRRAAFTLLEVLIALGLSIVLLSAIYAAVDIHWKYQVAGRAEIARGQLFRSLTKRINSDLASIVRQQSKPSASASVSEADEEESSSTNSNSSSSISTTAKPNDPEATPLTLGVIPESPAPLTFGLVGNAEVMHISVSQPSRNLAYTGVFEQQTPKARLSDLLVISYGLAPIDAERLKTLQQNLTSSRPAVGLGRRAIDLYTQQGGLEALGPETLIAPEITEVSFRYFDGLAWVETWDSQTSAKLPTAVEVTFGYWTPPPRQNRRKVNHTQPGTVTAFPHVYYIPISLPAESAEAL